MRKKGSKRMGTLSRCLGWKCRADYSVGLPGITRTHYDIVWSTCLTASQVKRQNTCDSLPSCTVSSPRPKSCEGEKVDVTFWLRFTLTPTLLDPALDIIAANWG